MPFRCNTCGRPLYNRTRERWEFCGAVVPEALRLTEEQRRTLALSGPVASEPTSGEFSFGWFDCLTVSFDVADVVLCWLD